MFYNAMNVFVKKHYTPGNAMLFSAFIHFALTFSAFISFAGRVFRQITFKGERDGTEKPQHTLIIGTKEEYQQVVQLLQSSGSQKTIIGRIAVNTEEQDLMGYIAQVANMSRGFHSCEIIFCEGQLRYAQIIVLIQSLRKYHFMFYSANSHSIVGSYSKSRSGKTIAAALQKGIPI
jgi:FlaA1/EpsC-like NDP-sugar epimerase